MAEDLQVRQLRARLDAARAALGDDAPQQPARVVEPPGMFRGLTDAVGQGATFGLADEVGAAGEATAALSRKKLRTFFGAEPDDKDRIEGVEDPGWSDYYNRALQSKRDSNKAFKQEHPVLSTGAELAGGLVMAPTRAATRMVGGQAVPEVVSEATRIVAPAKGITIAEGLPGAATTAGKIGEYGKAVATAAGQGALGGFGSGEGEADRLKNAAIGGAVGGGIAAAAPVVANVVGKTFGKGLDIAGLRNADKAATSKILQAFERDGITPEQALAKLDEWRAAGAKPEMLIDLGGENVRGLARAAAGTPSAAKSRTVQALRERQQGQADRIFGDVSRDLSPNTNFYGSVDDLIAKRKAQAGPLYDEAYSAVPAVWNDELAALANRPGFKSAYAKARTIAADEGHELPQVFKMDGAGNILGTQSVPDMRVIDYIKRGLDDVVQGHKNPLTGRIETDSGRASDSLRQQFLNAVDAINPAYAKARAAFAGPTRSMEAMELGRGIFGKDSELTAKAINALPDGDKEFFRAGVARAIKDAVDNAPDGADAVKRIFGSPAKREKLAAAFGSEEALNRFRASLERESKMFENATAVSPKVGAQTQLRQQEAADMAMDSIPGLLTTLAERGARAAAGQVVQSGLRRFQGMNSNTADALSNSLVNPSGADNRTLLARLIQQRNTDQLAAGQRERLARLLSGLEGREIGVSTN